MKAKSTSTHKADSKPAHLELGIARISTINRELLHFPISYSHMPEGRKNLSKEWMLKTLESLGLKRFDAEVYVYLVHHGSQKAGDIAEILEIYRRQLYRSLKNLQLKGMISVGQERPALFSAVSFDKVLDSFIISNREVAQYIEQNKDRILAVWRSKDL